jgi:hypothetical protein
MNRSLPHHKKTRYVVFCAIYKPLQINYSSALDRHVVSYVVTKFVEGPVAKMCRIETGNKNSPSGKVL